MSATLLERPTIAVPGDQEVGFVTLTVADQICGIPVMGVRDILADQAITRVPLAPPEVAGNLNLRGRIVTAVDLRRRLNLPAASGTRMSVVVEHGAELYALLVDQVSEVLSLRLDAMERNPSTLAPIWAAHSVGIYRLDGQLLVVLDVPRVLAIAPE